MRFNSVFAAMAAMATLGGFNNLYYSGTVSIERPQSVDLDNLNARTEVNQPLIENERINKARAKQQRKLNRKKGQ